MVCVLVGHTLGCWASGCDYVTRRIRPFFEAIDRSCFRSMASEALDDRLRTIQSHRLSFGANHEVFVSKTLENRCREAFHETFFNKIIVPSPYMSQAIATLMARAFLELFFLPKEVKNPAIALFIKNFNEFISMTNRQYGFMALEKILVAKNSVPVVSRWKKRLNFLVERGRVPDMMVPSSWAWVRFRIRQGFWPDSNEVDSVMNFLMRTLATVSARKGRLWINRSVFVGSTLKERIVHELTHLVFDEVDDVLRSWMLGKMGAHPVFLAAQGFCQNPDRLLMAVLDEFYAHREELLWARAVEPSLVALMEQAAFFFPTERTFWVSLGDYPSFLKVARRAGPNGSDVSQLAQDMVVEKYIHNTRWLGTLIQIVEHIPGSMVTEERLKGFRRVLQDLLETVVGFNPPKLDDIIQTTR